MSSEDENILFGEESPRNVPFPDRHRRKDRNGNIRVDKTQSTNPLDHASDPLINKLHTMRDIVDNCPQVWSELSQHCPDKRALLDEHMCDEKIDVTFAEMSDLVKKSAAIFAGFGVKKGVNVAILGENSARWLMVDHGIQLAGGATAVRGADAPIDEARYIYEHSDSAGIAVLQDPKLLQKLAKDATARGLSNLGLTNKSHGPVQHVILINRGKSSDEDIVKMVEGMHVQVHVFADLLERTKPIDPSLLPTIGREDLSTIVYTSGTTGQPKGVMLTHGNLLHQTSHRLAPTKQYEEGEPLPGETMVSLLPVWHITERTFELWILSRGCNVVYSSIRTFKNDLAKHKPEWMVLVPRVLEKVATGVQDKFSSGTVAVKTLSKLFTKTSNIRATHTKISKGLIVGEEANGPLKRLASRALVIALKPINAVGDKLVWRKVKDGFGGNIKLIISGGSALPGSLETFYEASGLKICVGYGLTECSPLIAFRRSDSNLVTAGCVGKATLDTELRVVDPAAKTGETDRPSLSIGEIGVVLARGPQVMKGYYKNSEATAKAVDKFGWFDTGDLGRINPTTGDLILTGRAKDTIVLLNGENIEPQPIEDAILGVSPTIEQVMLMGQDDRRLVAILVLSPNELVNSGLLTKEEGTELQAANEKVNNPKCTEEEYQENCEILSKASDKLRSNQELQQALMADAKKATSGFRAWEQVGAVYLTLEPFAMINGQLTQSYKVKRASVMERYGNLLPK
jgi:long-chain acyl-CoA synthetase